MAWSLYEETDGYNFIPGNPLKDSWKYMEKKISRVRRILDGLSLGDEKVSPKLRNIIDETEHFVKSFERPGTVLCWKQLNPKLLYFDVTFDMM